jgi:sensor domain CHASE-containing protein
VGTVVIQSSRVSFFLRVALPLLLAAIAVTLLAGDLFKRSTQGANTYDRSRTEQVIAAMMRTQNHQIRGLLEDNANWDDAARQTYGEIDVEWLAETWGSGTATKVNYDIALIMQPDGKKAIVGFKDGSEFNPDISAYFKSDLSRLFSYAINGINKTNTVITTTNTDDGPDIR